MNVSFKTCCVTQLVCCTKKMFYSCSEKLLTGVCAILQLCDDVQRCIICAIVQFCNLCKLCIMKCLIGLILHNLERNFFRGAPLLNKYKNVFRISSPGISNSAIHVWPIAYNMCQGSSFLFCFMLQNITKVSPKSFF